MLGFQIKKEFSADKFSFVVLCLLALASTVYAIVTILPLFDAFFLSDDFVHIGFASHLKQNPLSCFSWNHGGWWRPLGYLFPALLYSCVGLNPFYFHLMAFLIFVLIGIALIRFCGRLKNLKTGLIAYSFFIVTPALVLVESVSTSAYQDGLSTLMYILALTSAYRTTPAQSDKRPYFLPFVFLLLSAFCKDSWCGLIPALIFVDFINYPSSSFVPRLRRLYPYVFLFLLIPIRFLVIGNLSVSQVEWQLGFFEIPGAITAPFTMPFAPYMVSDDISHFQILELIPFLLVFVLSIFFAKVRRKDMLYLWIAYVGLALILIPAGCLKDLYGFIHPLPLIALGMIIVSLLIVDIFKKLNIMNVLIVVLVLALHATLLRTEILSIMKYNIKSSKRCYNNYASFIGLLRSIPAGSHIYATNWYKACFVYLFISHDKYAYTQVVTKCRMNYEDAGFIIGDAKYLYDILSEKSKDNNFKFISEIDDKWKDITLPMKRFLSGAAKEEDREIVGKYLDQDTDYGFCQCGKSSH